MVVAQVLRRGLELPVVEDDEVLYVAMRREPVPMMHQLTIVDIFLR